MHTIIKRALWGVLIGGGISLLGAGVAQAADTSGEDGLLSGTQAILDVEAPVTVAGNAISVLGDSHSDDADTQAPAAAPAPAPAASTSGDDGAAAGAQAMRSWLRVAALALVLCASVVMQLWLAWRFLQLEWAA